MPADAIGPVDQPGHAGGVSGSSPRPRGHGAAVPTRRGGTGAGPASDCARARVDRPPARAAAPGDDPDPEGVPRR